MHKTLQKILAALLILAPAVAGAGDQATTAQAIIGQNSDSKPCQTLQTTGFNPYFFDNYEQHEYAQKFLVLHLKLKTPFNDGRRWLSGFYLYKADCSSLFQQISFNGFTPRPTMQFYSIRFTSKTHFELWDDEQQVQIMCGAAACTSDIPAVMPDGSSYSMISYQGTIDGGASGVVSDSLSVTEPIPPKLPVLIIPGILGTVMSESAQPVWPNLSAMIADPADGFMDQLRMDQDGKPLDIAVQPAEVLSKIDYPFGSFDYTAGLVDQFKADGYIPDQNVFLFGYDWRLSIAQNSAILGAAIKNILNKTGAAKLNIVAHSLGGLVLKQYLLNDQNQDINNVVLAGVPNLGSAEAVHQLIFGDNLGIPLLNPAEMQKISQNMSSIYELLPSSKYFAHTAGFYDDLTMQNSPVLNYGQSKNLLISLGKNPQMLNQAENLHNNLDNLDFSSKVGKIYVLVGCGQFTLKTINKMRQGSSSLLDRILHGPNYRVSGDSGDGTVLLSSATDVANAKIFYAHAKHSEMLAASGLKEAIVGFIDGRDSAALPTDPSSCGIQGKLVSLNSSLNIQITDAITGQPVNLNNLTRIGTGIDTHVFLPTDAGQKYKVAIKPADSIQPVDLSITKIQPGAATIYNYNQINLTKEADAQITPDSNTVDNLDSQGSEQNVPPSQVFDQNDLGNQTNNSAADQSGSGQNQGANNISQPPEVIYIQPQPQIQTGPNVSANPASGAENAADSQNTDPGLPEAPQGMPESSSAVPSQPNINITFEFPPGMFDSVSGKNFVSDSDSSESQTENISKPQNFESQNVENAGQNVFIGSWPAAKYFNFLKNLAHLIFF